MATFKAVVQDKRKDGTYQVKIRITHNRVVRRLATNIFVHSSGVTRGLKIKDQDVIDQADELIRNCRKICNNLGIALDSMSTDDLVSHIKLKLQDGGGWRLDFIDYTTKLASTMSPGTGGLYNYCYPGIEAVYRPGIARYIRNKFSIFEVVRGFLGKRTIATRKEAYSGERRPCRVSVHGTIACRL